MKSKIRWYREVLEIEPQSKVFFPLAKLLIENEQYQEAFKTLQQGLLRHPEFIEAKLLLVEVLSHLDKEEELDALVEDVASGIGEYPAFWEAWARQLSQEKDGYDPALAMRLLAAYFSGKSISWARIIEYGLKSLLDEQQEAPAPPLTGVEAVAKSRLSGVHYEDEVEEEEDAEEGEEAADLPLDHDERPETSEDPEEGHGPVGRRRLESIEAAVADTDLESEETAGAASTMKEIQESGEEGAEDLDDEEYDEGDEETFSLRTKTMADLLAEQGDYDGALDIYRELVAVAPDEETRKELEELAEQMRRLSQEKPGSNGGKAKKGATPPQKVGDKGLKSKKKLISALEALASRLEAKAAH